jgi:1-phosphofructokinase
VHDRRTGERRELVDVSPGPLARHELDDLYSVTLAAALEAGVCVLTGTHQHTVVNEDVYRRLASDLHQHGVKVLADLSGGMLTAALEGGLTLVKVSDEELLRDGWISETTPEQIDDAVARLAEAGAEQVIVSGADRGCRASVAGAQYRVHTPTMDAVDHHGAGDAMTGALAVGLACSYDADRLLRMAAAAGAATVVRHGFATGTRDAVHALADLVEVVDAA